MNEYEKIREYLNKNKEIEFDNENLAGALSKLSIYHEELKFQNDELKHTEQVLSESRERYRNLFLYSPIGYVIIDEDGIILEMNEAATKLLGINIKDEFSRAISAESQDLLYLFIRKAYKGFEASVDLSSEKSKGQRPNLRLTGKRIEDNGRPVVQCAVSDISVLNEYEKSLEKIEALFDNPYVGLAFLDKKGYIQDSNKKFKEMINRDKDFNFLEIISDPQKNNISGLFNQLLSGELSYLSEEIMADVSEEKYFRVTVYGIDYNSRKRNAFLLTIFDISEQKIMEMERSFLESKMRNNQRLEAIDNLASGIAHEINNPLNGIMNYAQLIHDDPENLSQTIDFSKEIVYESERISRIVTGLLKFSKNVSGEIYPEDINQMIEQTVVLMNTIVKQEGIKFRCLLEKDLPLVECKRQEIQQVLMNIITNSRDALLDKYDISDDEKTIVIKTEKSNINGRDYVKFSIRDYGTGIPEEIQGSIYNPFFSTKGRIKGTGLGLSISYGIIKEHNGIMDFTTEIDKYTEFQVYLPVKAEL